MSYNKWVGVGNLGRDAEMRFTGDGTAVANFSIACNEKWTDKAGQKQERVEWVRCSYWGKPAEAVAQYLTKGKQVLIEGRMQTRKWQDKDGVEKSTTEIRVDRLVLLGGSGGGRQRPNGDAEAEYDGPAQTTARDRDDEPPF